MKNYRSFIDSLSDLDWTDDEDNSNIEEFDTDYFKLKKQFTEEELIELALAVSF